MDATIKQWAKITGHLARVDQVRMLLPDFLEFDPEIIDYWEKAVRIYEERYVEPNDQKYLRKLTPARQKWVKTTGIKAFSQSVIDVLPECNFSLNTERDWLLLTSIYAKRYPEKVLVQNSEIEVLEKDDKIIKPSRLCCKKYLK
ncbi:hypothetical protein [Nostoc sp. MG11]|uniref:hypothetical protein n=1 Tax=Nostoc sp. MG11 TaxID=2721166 RepID=UPI001867B847|nr:hypothetical protein [Nostoc sp. MG11]